jgi:hypothetical protein
MSKDNQSQTASDSFARNGACHEDEKSEAVAVPSNTATNNCNNEENVKESIN